MNATSPKSSLAKLGLYGKPKPFRIMVLGQTGVGKSALVVRYITRRFIGEYDPTLEKIYSYNSIIDNDIVYMEILDSVGEPQMHVEGKSANLEANIRWADAFILMYSVTDKCSFDECHRLKFLINYNKRRRRLGGSYKEGLPDIPVTLVGNKTDQAADRMISTEEGHRRCKEIGCVAFHEISVRESVEQVVIVFGDTCRWWKVNNKFPRVRRAASDPPPVPASLTTASGKILDRRRTDDGLEEEDEDASESGLGTRSSSTSEGSSTSTLGLLFRSRASTDGQLNPRNVRTRYPAPPSHPPSGSSRRMSIAMRGDNATTY